MSKRPSLYWEDNSSFNYLSIRDEYAGFAFMFCVFSFLAIFTTILLIVLAQNAYYHDSEQIQRRFLGYVVIGSISLILFLVFFIGLLVYICKSIKQYRSKPTSTPPIPTPRSIENLTRETNSKAHELFPMPTDESYYSSAKILAQQNSRSKSVSYQVCQTDV